MDLFCDEDISSLKTTSTETDESLDFFIVSESDCEFIEMSLLKETNFKPSDPDENPASKSTRLEALEWILQTSIMLGYHNRTVYLSLIYFDRFWAIIGLSDAKPTWTSRILSIACLSIAAKMEEQKAHSFKEYHVDGYKFQGGAVQKMELCVLNTLEWKMVVITPFTYLNYFVFKFCVEKSRQQEIVNQAVDLILVIMEEMNVAEIRPSIVAAASVLAAYDCQLHKKMLENKIDAIPTWGSKEKEQTFSCYCLLQDVLMLKTPKSEIIPSSLSVVETKITSRGGSKRRLAFDDNNDHYCPVKKSSLS
ncbi:hypothetical protein CASFOL_018150 [Castilleja foliolosa]|uniref:Cyclin-like domain-containing protein n=1 Tax=Castilleja foliolosa TaxID=1961234 RepID=A0ABD3D7M4_9LAMI